MKIKNIINQYNQIRSAHTIRSLKRENKSILE